MASTKSLACEAVKDGFISQDVLDQLTSLHPQVPNSMKHRYLLACFRSRLNRLIENKEPVERFRKYIDFGAPIDHGSDSHLFGSEHLRELTELLVDYAYKWRSIGIALMFQPQDLDNIEACSVLIKDSPKSYLVRLLEEWLLEKNQHTLPPSKHNLEIALKSKTVGLGSLACKLQGLSMICGSVDHSVNGPYLVVKVSLFPSDMEFLAFPLTLTIEEGSSTIVEVQAVSNRNEECTYQWYHNEMALHHQSFLHRHLGRSRQVGRFQHAGRYEDKAKAPEALSYVSPESFLYLYEANIEWDGSQIFCEVSCDSDLVTTTPVTLEVNCSLDKFRSSLASMYLTQPADIEDTWPPICSETFINLALTKQQKANFGSKHSRRSTIRGGLDNNLQRKDMIEYEDVYNNLHSGQLILIKGRPGSGKTTFVHKITQDWANESGGPIRLLLLVSLRVLNNLDTPSPGLSDILKLFTDLKVNKELVEERDGKGVCFIFDGLDEFSPSDGQSSIVFKIINKAYLHLSTVIVASRPAAIAHLMRRASKVIEVMGFLQEQIFEYFDSYPFSDSSKPQKLKAYLLAHPNVLHMCYLPVYAAMVAFLFEVTERVPTTETEIYTHFTCFTLVRTRMTKGHDQMDNIDLYNLEGEEKGCFEQICRLAFENTLCNKQMLQQDEVSSYFDVRKGQDTNLGLITVDRTAGLYGIKDIYTFLHLTFQEYLAAYHISTLSDEEQSKVIEQHGEKYHMLVLWKFCCGLRISKEAFKSILEKTKGNTLYQIQCAHESQQQVYCDELLETLDHHLKLEEKTLSTSIFTAIGYIANMSALTFKLTLLHCKINIEPVDALLTELFEAEHSLQNIHIETKTVDAEQMECVTKLLTHIIGLKQVVIKANIKTEFPEADNTNCSSIKLFQVTDLSIINTDISQLGILEELPYAELTKLDLTGSISRVSESEVLTRGLQHCKTLEELNLNGCKKIEMIALVAALADSCLLRKLYLNRTRVKDDEAKILSAHLRHWHELEELRLADNLIHGIGSKALAVNLHLCTQLQQLDLQDNNIDEKGANAIVRSLNKIRNFQTLNLSNTRIHLMFSPTCHFQIMRQ